MNRLSLHQSLLHPRTPVDTVDLAAATGWDSVGFHVGAVEEAEPWWSGGAGQRLLAATIERLLESRVTVLDVGRVVLGPRDELAGGFGVHERVLDFGARLGAQFVVARFASGMAPAAQAERFAVFAEQARPFRLRPLLAAVPVDRPEDFAEISAVVGGSGGGVVLDVPVHTSSADLVAEAVAELWEHIGYVRIDARALELEGDRAAGQLAVLPPHIPVVIGGDESRGVLADDAVARLTGLRLLVDRMLEHPRARGAREQRG